MRPPSKVRGAAISYDRSSGARRRPAASSGEEPSTAEVRLARWPPHGWATESEVGFREGPSRGGRRSARRRTDLLQPELWRPRGTVLQSRLMVRSWRVRRAEPASIQAGRKVAEPAHGSAPREPKPSEAVVGPIC